MCQACDWFYPDDDVPEGYEAVVDTGHLCKQTLPLMVPVGDGTTIPRTELRTYVCEVQKGHVGPHRFSVTTPNRGVLVGGQS